MNPAETILAEIGEGPATVTLESGDAYEIDFENVDVDDSSFRAEGIGQSNPDLVYRLTEDPHSELGPLLERRHTGEADWEELGYAAFASQES